MGFAALCIALLLAPGLFGSVRTAQVIIVGIVLAVGLLVTPVSRDRRALPASAWLVIMAFAAVAGLGLAQISLTIPPDASFPALFGGAEQRLANTQWPTSVNPGRTGEALGVILVNLLAFLLGLRFGSSDERVARVVFACAATIMALALLTMVLMAADPSRLLWISKSAYRDSLTGPFVNRNTAATYFGTGLLSVMMLAHAQITRLLQGRSTSPGVRAGSRERLTLLMALAALAMLALAVVLTRSRAGLFLTISIAGAFACATFFRLHIKAALRAHPWRAAIILAVTVIVICAMLVVVIDQVGERGASDGGRLEVYAATFRLALQYPWWGIGLGGFADIFPLIRPGNLASQGVWDRAHNTVLELALEVGLPVTALTVLSWLAAAATLARNAWRRRSARRIPLLGLAVGLLASLHSLLDFSLQIPGYSVVFFILLGACLAAAGSTAGQAISANATRE